MKINNGFDVSKETSSKCALTFLILPGAPPHPKFLSQACSCDDNDVPTQCNMCTKQSNGQVAIKDE